MPAETTPVAAPPPNLGAPSPSEVFSGGQVTNPNQPLEGILAEDLFGLLFGGTRRYFRLSTEDAAGDTDTWIERVPGRGNSFFTFDRIPMPLNSWTKLAFHSSPYRPQARFSPCVYSSSSPTSPLDDLFTCWAIFPIELDRSNPKSGFPAIDRRSQAAARERVAALPIQPWCVIDAASSLTAIWRLSSSVHWDYVSLLADRIARASGALPLPLPSGGVRSAVASMLAAKNMDSASLHVAQDADRARRKTAMSNVLIPMPGQVAGVLPRHLITATFLGSMTDTIKVEELSRAYMAPKED